LLVLSAGDRGDILKLSTNLFLGAVGRALIHFGVMTPMLIFQEGRKGVTIHGETAPVTNLRGSTANLQMILEDQGTATQVNSNVAMGGGVIGVLRSSAAIVTEMFAGPSDRRSLVAAKNESQAV